MARYTLASLIEIMAQLRSEEGCPWDREQTHQSLTRYLIEEAYEVIDAIEEQDDQARRRAGRCTLQVVFHAQLEQKTGGLLWMMR